MFTDERHGGYLHIGQTKVPLRPEHDAAAMVPDVLFYDNQQVGPSSTTNTLQFFTRVFFSYYFSIFAFWKTCREILLLGSTYCW